VGIFMQDGESHRLGPESDRFGYRHAPRDEIPLREPMGGLADLMIDHQVALANQLREMGSGILGQQSGQHAIEAFTGVLGIDPET
jgi:hypothetical protein